MLRTPGTSSKALRRPLRSIPNLRATSPEVFPWTRRHSTSGALPRLSSTEDTRDTRPRATSSSIRTLPSVADTTTSSIPGKRVTARVAFMAQSGQSMPRSGHSKRSTPSTTSSGATTASESDPGPAIGVTCAMEPSSRSNSSTGAAAAARFSREEAMRVRTAPTPPEMAPRRPVRSPPRESLESEFDFAEVGRDSGFA